MGNELLELEHSSLTKLSTEPCEALINAHKSPALRSLRSTQKNPKSHKLERVSPCSPCLRRIRIYTSKCFLYTVVYVSCNIRKIFGHRRPDMCEVRTRNPCRFHDRHRYRHQRACGPQGGAEPLGGDSNRMRRAADSLAAVQSTRVFRV